MSARRSFKNRLFVFAMTVISANAFAGMQVLPDSRHQQYQTYGLFFDQQSLLAFRQEGRAWGALAGSIAALELTDWKWNPQLVIHGSANASFKINGKGDTLLTETIDARVGLAVDLKFESDFRGSIIWTHYSGHVSDNVADLDLFGSNLGNEVLDLRLIKDIDTSYRFGLGIRPTLGSDPGMIAFGAEQFFEWFPTGEAADPHHFAPYFATGFEEYGRHAIRFTWHAQIGIAAGNHFGETKHSSLRGVVGYYNGNDPRLKYYQFKDRRVDFFYGGVAFDI